jgi:hypothetical protein
MFVEFIYMYEQYNPETARRNTPKLKHSIPIEKTKHLPQRNWQPWSSEGFEVQNILYGVSFYSGTGKRKFGWAKKSMNEVTSLIAPLNCVGRRLF